MKTIHFEDYDFDSEEKYELFKEMADRYRVDIRIVGEGINSWSDYLIAFIKPHGGCYMPLTSNIYISEDYVENLTMNALRVLLLHESAHAVHHRTKFAPFIKFWEKQAEFFVMQNYDGTFEEYNEAWAEIIWYSFRDIDNSLKFHEAWETANISEGKFDDVKFQPPSLAYRTKNTIVSVYSSLKQELEKIET